MVFIKVIIEKENKVKSNPIEESGKYELSEEDKDIISSKIESNPPIKQLHEEEEIKVKKKELIDEAIDVQSVYSEFIEPDKINKNV